MHTAILGRDEGPGLLLAQGVACKPKNAESGEGWVGRKREQEERTTGEERRGEERRREEKRGEERRRGKKENNTSHKKNSNPTLEWHVPLTLTAPPKASWVRYLPVARFLRPMVHSRALGTDMVLYQKETKEKSCTGGGSGRSGQTNQNQTTTNATIKKSQTQLHTRQNTHTTNTPHSESCETQAQWMGGLDLR